LRGGLRVPTIGFFFRVVLADGCICRCGGVLCTSLDFLFGTR